MVRSRRNRVSTGIPPLDKKIGGGIPAGSTVVVKAAADSQSELFMYTVTGVRDAVYISTIRNNDAVREAFNSASVDVGSPYITYAEPGTTLSTVRDTVERSREDMNVIIDCINRLEDARPGEYQKFLNTLNNHLTQTDGVGYMHLFEDDDPHETRYMTESAADIIFEVETVVAGTDMDHYLQLKKSRYPLHMDERLKIEMATRVDVDTSRDIA